MRSGCLIGPPPAVGRYQEQYGAVSAGFREGPAARLRKFLRKYRYRVTQVT